MKIYRVLAWLLWAALPLTAVRYWEAWDRLPATLIVRFDGNDFRRPVAFMTRGRLFIVEIGVITIVGALTFFPALSLGPILEHLLLGAGKTF